MILAMSRRVFRIASGVSSRSVAAWKRSSKSFFCASFNAPVISCADMFRNSFDFIARHLLPVGQVSDLTALFWRQVGNLTHYNHIPLTVRLTNRHLNGIL